MKKEQTHIIEKLLVDVDTSTSQSAYELKDNISNFINGTLVTTLNSYFEQKGQELGTTSIQLEHFSLDLNISERDFDSKYIRETIESEIARQLDPILNDPESSIVQYKQSDSNNSFSDSSTSDFVETDPSRAIHLTEKQKQWKAIVHFLETGTTPWWIKTNEEMTSLMESGQMTSILQEETDLIRTVLSKKLSDSGFKSRVIRQLENEAFVSFLNVTKSASIQLLENDEFLQSFNKRTDELSIQNREFYRSLLIELVTSNASPIPPVLHLIESTIDRKLGSSSEPTNVVIEERVTDLVALSAAIISDTPQQTIPFETFKKEVTQHLKQTDFKKDKAETSQDDLKLSEQNTKQEGQQIADQTKPAFLAQETSKETTIESKTEQDQSIEEIAEEKNVTQSEKFKTDKEMQETKQSSDDPVSDKKSSMENQISDSANENYRDLEKTGLRTEEELQQAIQRQNIDAENNSEASGIQGSGEKASNAPEISQDMESTTESNASITNETNSHENERTIRDLRIERVKDSSTTINKKLSEVELQNIKSEKDSPSTEKESNLTDTAHTHISTDSTKDQTVKETKTEDAESSALTELSKEEQFEALKKKLEPEQLIIDINQLPKTPIPAANGFIAENAGLVLLHPFLKHLFLKLDLLDNNNQLKDPVLAVHILHFAATGIECDYEYSMTFEKYLCNVPLDVAIPKEIQLSDETKQQVDTMLGATLDYWKALKSKSIALLRHEFLQRPGKLIIDEQSPRIVFERKAFDLMLDKLPWNISIVKLAWLDSMIFVEW